MNDIQYEFLIADDHAIVRDGLSHELKGHFNNSIIDSAEDGLECLNKMSEKKYDLVIFDINMPNTQGFKVIAKLIEEYPSTPIVIFSMNPENIYARRYYKLGVKGYVNKKSELNTLIDACKLVLNGAMYFGNEFTAEMLNSEEELTLIDQLSDREFEIMKLYVEGYSSKMISESLCIHTSTIGTYRFRIFKKLNIDNLVDLYQFAVVNNIV